MISPRLILIFLLVLPWAASAQNVGIGTTTPHDKALLDLTSTAKGLLVPRMTSAQRTAIAAPPAGLTVYQTDGTSGYYYHDGSVWKRLARAEEVGGAGSWTVAGDDQYSSVDGDVGIGTSTPSAKLHVVGNVLQEGSSFTLNHATGIVQLQSGGVNKGYMQLSGNNLRIGTNSGNTSGSLIVRMNGTDRMTMDSIGRLALGIANPDPSARMHLHSTALGFLPPRMTTNQRIGINSPANGLLVYDTDKNEYYHHNGSGWETLLNSNYWVRPITNRDRITNTADSVGVGITSPLARLHVSNGSFANYTTQNGHIMVGSATSTNLAIGDYEILARDNGAAAPLYLQQDGGTVRLGSGTVATGTKLHITGGEEAGLSTHGYVLLGTTTGEGIAIDDNDIQAKDAGVATYLKLQQSAGPGIQVGFFNTATHPDAKIYVPSGDDAGLSSDGYVHLGQKTGTNLVMDNNEIQARNNGAASTLFVQDGGGAFRVGNNKLFVDTDGEVGIGTTNPFAKLDVIGRIRVFQGNEAIGIDGNNPYLGLWYNGSYRSKVQQLTDQLYIHSNDKVHLDGDQVAIGDMLSTANDYKLTVTGKIICEELKVELAANWPDYVFRNDYILRPIDELKAFIQENGHLPNIPKAAEVEKEGFEVGEMNRRLLEKVEELTLYVIELQEQIDRLKTEKHD